MTRRHEVLRTRFVEIAGAAAQEIAAAEEMALPVTDLSGLSAEAQAAAVDRLAAELVARPFALRTGPLLRAAVARCAADHHVLMVVVHHIVFDGWSAAVFFREMVAIYAARARGATPELPPLAIQYADYAVWQRALWSGPRRGPLQAFWQQQLAGRPPSLALPTDRPRPAAQGFRGEKLRFEIGAALTARLEELGRTQGASLFMTMLAAHGALLARYARQDEIVVGCPVANRARREIEPLVGFFVNPLPMRIDLRGAGSFADLLSRVRRTVLAAYDHQALPFELIVEAIQPARDPSRHPVFQTLLIYQNARAAAPEAPGLSIEAREFSAGPARTDLDLYLWEGAAGLAGYFIYDTALFDAPTVARLADRWQTLLQSAVDEPTRPLADLRTDRPASRPPLPRLTRRPGVPATP